MATDGKVVALERRRKGKPAVSDPVPPAEPTDDAVQPSGSAPGETMVLRVVLVFHVDGQAVAHAPFVAQLPRPAADQAGQLQIALDSRVLMQMLEPHLGPSQASASAMKPKLWTPGGA